MRYLINKDNWDSNGGPIFFYCGNEGDIELFAANTVSKGTKYISRLSKSILVLGRNV